MIKKIYNTILYGFAIIGAILMLGFVASKSSVTDQAGKVDNKTDYYQQNRNINHNKNYLWLNTEEYLTLKEALVKEKIVLERIEKEIQIKPRLLLSIVFTEQMRLYSSNREIFKKVFEPLKILGVQSQFSWGVLGLKEETLIQIENNLASTTSLFYLGQEYQNILAFDNLTEDIGSERFMRVTDEHNHYYTYLYAGIFLKQIQKQWQDQGFDISDKPEILATLYNIGFKHSKPKVDPESGGAEIEINNIKYSFGELTYEFYYSDELIDIFPR